MNIIVILPVVLYTGATLVEQYVYFKDNESCEDEQGAAYNLHVTNRKCVQNSGQSQQEQISLTSVSSRLSIVVTE